MFPSTIRTGFVMGEETGPNETSSETEMVVALMRVFMKDAIVVAGRYTCAHGRRSVSGEDMQRALKYCARTFFQRNDQELSDVLKREQEEMQEEEEEEESEEGEEEEESEEESGENEEEEHNESEIDPSDVQLAKNVDCVVKNWDIWNPEDPVYALIKRAIDNTPIS